MTSHTRLESSELQNALRIVLAQDYGVTKASIHAILANVLREVARESIDRFLETTDLRKRFEDMLKLAIENRLAQLRPANMAEDISAQISAQLAEEVKTFVRDNIDFKLRPKPKQGRALIT